MRPVSSRIITAWVVKFCGRKEVGETDGNHGPGDQDAPEEGDEAARERLAIPTKNHRPLGDSGVWRIDVLLLRSNAKSPSGFLLDQSPPWDRQMAR